MRRSRGHCSFIQVVQVVQGFVLFFCVEILQELPAFVVDGIVAEEALSRFEGIAVCSTAVQGIRG